MARQRPLQAVKSAAVNADRTIDVLRADLRALLAEIQNGVTIRVIKDKSSPHTIMDFVMGQCDELPVALKIEVKDRQYPHGTTH
jgi:hypothetical protein